MTAHYELRIRPNQSWIIIDWLSLWRYRDLLFILVRRDFVSRYKQTILGPLWFILQPVLTTAVFVIIFANFARISTDGLPPVLFYLCGMLGWSYFANTFSSTSTTLVSNAGLFGKVYFPRLIVPLSSVVSNLFALGIQFATFLGFLCYFKFFTPAGRLLHVHWQVLLFPFLIVQLAALSLGVGLWISALTAKYRDFTHLAGFLVQLWLYATPVIFPLSLIPEKWRWLVVLNPLTMPIEIMKYSFLGEGAVDLFYSLISLVVSSIFLFTGLLVFQKAERTFVDTV